MSEFSTPWEMRNNPEFLLAWDALRASIESEKLTRRQAYEQVTGKPIPLSEQSFDDWWIQGQGYELPRFGVEVLGKEF